ncbi:MAG: CARDB domain-containing protein, partial [Candidatus Woesearchaeota archaeon]
YNHSLSLDEILVHNETGYNRLVTKEFALNDNLTCEVTPNDAFGDGNTLRENTTILEGISIDIWTNSTYISLGNNTPPAELENILINTTIFNSGTSNASNVIIQFYDGDPALNGIQIGSNITVNISANSNVTINTSWIASVGTHYIFVTIDSDNNISETNEDNNIANKSITISSWVVYYGKINTTIYLTNNQNSSFIKWLGENVTGNIYISDSDTDNGISWTTLKPVWQNTTGYNNSDTINDFEEIDSLLGLENNTDSINKTFTLNNIPKNFDNFNIFSISLVNVSIDNSTNTSNFITGVLWDSSDSSNSYYDITDKEDIIFVTKINKNKDGKYGIYDYEIKIPGFLRDYKGTNANVDLYYEIN